MTAPVITEMPETIAMTSPVQVQAEEAAGEGNGADGSTYKCDSLPLCNSSAQTESRNGSQKHHLLECAGFRS